MTTTLHVGDCRVVLPTLPASSVHAIVTDPPYDLTTGKKGGTGERSMNLQNPYGRARAGGFMAKAWDATGVAFDPETWTACLRVLKPGGHLLAFGGTRTIHRMTVAIEDAGFEIRDQIAWMYATGFPKSLDVSKAIDKAAGAEREILRENPHNSPGRKDGKSAVLGGGPALMGNKGPVTAPATDAAKQWDGWGTALAPAMELIVVARKPLVGTVAANVLAHGAGGLNINACLIGTEKDVPASPSRAPQHDIYGDLRKDDGTGQGWDPNVGRWPKNVILDEEAAAMLDAAVGERKSGRMNGTYASWGTQGIYGAGKPVAQVIEGSSGPPSRFFFVAKASTSERWGILTCHCETDKLASWESQDRNQPDQTDSMSPPRDTFAGTSGAASASPTSSPGNTSTDPFHQDSTSTTSTGTRPTTPSKTSCSSPRPNTSEFIQGAISETAFGGSPAKSVANSSPSTSTTGISVPKGGLSTAAAAPVTSLRSSATNVCANCGKPKTLTSHPTQKPIALMRQLVRLVTPKGGVVLDPFAGSGSTLVAAELEEMTSIGIELTEDYVPIIEGRVRNVAPMFIQMETIRHGAETDHRPDQRDAEGQPDPGDAAAHADIDGADGLGGRARGALGPAQ